MQKSMHVAGSHRCRKVCILQGALVGGATGLVFSVWLTTGSLMRKRRHPILPPLSIDECTAASNLTFPNYYDTNSSSVFHFTDEPPVNSTMTFLSPPTNQTISVRSSSRCSTCF